MAQNRCGVTGKADFLEVEDWCLFRGLENDKIFGRVLSFAYLTGKTKKNKLQSESAEKSTEGKL